MSAVSLPMESYHMNQPVSDPDVSALVAWTQNSDRAALESLFARHAETALRLAWQRLGNLNDAEDAVQEGFLWAMRNARRFEAAKGKVQAWLLNAVLAASAEHRRSGTRRKERERQIPPPIPVERDQDLKEVVTLAMTELPEHQRRAIELRFFAGLSYHEIAAALGRKENTLRNHVDRGLEALRTICARHGIVSTPVMVAGTLEHLPRPTFNADSIVRCTSVATHGPTAIVGGGLGMIYVGSTLAVLATASVVVGGMRGWFGGNREKGLPAIVAPLEETHAVSATTSQIIGEYRIDTPSNGLGLVGSISIFKTNFEMPIISVGALREDVVDLNAWKTSHVISLKPGLQKLMEQFPIKTPVWFWSSSPSQLQTIDQTTYQPNRWLRAPRPGDEVFVVCISPNDKMHWPLDRDWRPKSLSKTTDGWNLTLDGVNWSVRSRDVTPAPSRRIQVFSLGKVAVGEYRLNIDVHWRQERERSELFYRSDSKGTNFNETGVLTIPVVANASGDPLLLNKLDPMVEVQKPNNKQQFWQIPHQQNLISITNKVPDDKGGLIGTIDSPPVWFDLKIDRSKIPTDTSGVLVLGPQIQSFETMTLRSVTWDGPVATITMAVWQDHGPRKHNIIWRPLIPVRLIRPPGVTGPVTAVLQWEHLIADNPGGTYVPQDLSGKNPFPGTQRLENIDLPIHKQTE